MSRLSTARPPRPAALNACSTPPGISGPLRAAHLEFAARWQTADPPPAESLPQFLLLISDWGRLLRTDPGLPEAYVDQDWPADHSTQIFRRLESRLGSLAERQLEQLMLPNE